MQQSGEHHIPAPRARVWEALNDAEVLAACLDGCEKLERVADDRFDALIKAKVGPVSATFTGVITLHDIDPPSSYQLQVEAKGGAAGFGKGTADVGLRDADGGGTTLSYEVNASVGGKLAQIGSRLIDGVARKMADSFFNQFVERLGGDAGGAREAGDSDAMSQAPGELIAEPEQRPRWPLWLGVAIVLIVGLALAL